MDFVDYILNSFATYVSNVLKHVYISNSNLTKFSKFHMLKFPIQTIRQSNAIFKTVNNLFIENILTVYSEVSKTSSVACEAILSFLAGTGGGVKLTSS